MRPERLIADNELSAAAWQVLTAIYHSPSQNQWHRVSHTTLQRMTGRAKNTIRRALLQLETKGYLLITPVREAGTLRQTHQYLVVIDGAKDE